MIKFGNSWLLHIKVNIIINNLLLQNDIFLHFNIQIIHNYNIHPNGGILTYIVT